MSLLPYILDDFICRPSRIVDQHFGMGLDDWDMENYSTIPRLIRSPYFRPWINISAARDTGSMVNFGKDKFEAKLDVQQFAPDEINVKVTGDNTVTIEGKHEEKQDEHGYISRHFVRKYVLPPGHDINQLVSNLSSDGVLSITAPRMDKKEENERSIPIIQTGKPSKTIKEKESKTDQQK